VRSPDLAHPEFRPADTHPQLDYSLRSGGDHPQTVIPDLIRDPRGLGEPDTMGAAAGVRWIPALRCAPAGMTEVENAPAGMTGSPAGMG
jgi:hypothetical protein